jgi:hypothetical protein
VLRYEDIPDPACPDGCVIVGATAISIEGGNLLARAARQLPAVPHVVGYLSAGTVSEVAAVVEERAVGDRVVALNAAGSHAARQAVPAAMTSPIPDGLDPVRGRRACRRAHRTRYRPARPSSATTPVAPTSRPLLLPLAAETAGVPTLLHSSCDGHLVD